MSANGGKYTYSCAFLVKRICIHKHQFPYQPPKGPPAYLYYAQSTHSLNYILGPTQHTCLEQTQCRAKEPGPLGTESPLPRSSSHTHFKSSPARNLASNEVSMPLRYNLLITYTPRTSWFVYTGGFFNSSCFLLPVMGKLALHTSWLGFSCLPGLAFRRSPNALEKSSRNCGMVSHLLFLFKVEA